MLSSENRAIKDTNVKNERLLWCIKGTKVLPDQNTVFIAVT